MSVKGKQTITSIVSGFLFMVGYLVYALSNRAPATDDLKGWAIVMLMFIGISILALILIQVLFAIALSFRVAFEQRDKREKNIEEVIASSYVEDEMDTLISLKSNRIGYSLCGIGFLAALILLATGISAVIALNVMLISMCIASLIEGAATFYFYERGV